MYSEHVNIDRFCTAIETPLLSLKAPHNDVKRSYVSGGSRKLQRTVTKADATVVPLVLVERERRCIHSTEQSRRYFCRITNGYAMENDGAYEILKIFLPLLNRFRERIYRHV